MSAIRNLFNKMRPSFEEGGKLHAFRSVFDGFETFALVPNDTAKSGVNIHDAIDSKRIMSMVVIALMPAMLFGMYNVGYQNYLAAGTLATASFLEISSLPGHSGRERRFRRVTSSVVSSSH